MSFILLGLPLLSLGFINLPLNIKLKIQGVLILTILNLLHILFLIIIYDPHSSQFQFQLTLFENVIGGIDGISIWLIFLVNLIIPIVILDSWKTIKINLERFISLVLLVNFWSIAVFLVLDLLFFYISFEALLIPMYFLIGFFGSRNKKIEEAQNKFFIYTLFGSLFLLLAIITIYLYTGTTDYQILLSLPISFSFQLFLWFAFFLAFAIKTPMWPFHIWLPVAHGESSTGTSVILAAILLKLGTYGFLRYSLPLFPLASQYFLPLVLMLAIISILYSCLAAFSLLDLKSIIAYSSIAHMNVGIIGIFSNDLNGLSGAYLYSISHGLASSGLFLLAGFIYERFHTKTLKYFRGIVLIMPIFVTFFFLFTLSNLSFPLSLGFIAEFMILLSTIELSPFISFFTVLVTILLPFYFIWTFQRISYGSFSNFLPLVLQDINIKEFHLLFPLIFLTLVFGCSPALILDTIQFSLFSLIY